RIAVALWSSSSRSSDSIEQGCDGMAMTRIRVALLPSAVCIAGTDPVLKIKDTLTGEVATDRETGASLYTVTVMLMEVRPGRGPEDHRPGDGSCGRAEAGGDGTAGGTVRAPVGADLQRSALRRRRLPGRPPGAGDGGGDPVIRFEHRTLERELSPL